MQDNPLVKYFIAPGLSLLPSKMDTREAAAMLIAIGLQESRFQYRLQIGGPARGFWQFEKNGGIRGVLTHPSTRGLVYAACEQLRFEPSVEVCYEMVAWNDTLACVFARLLLWTLPDALPGPGNPDEGWRQYISAWRPGRPHRETWDGFYKQAWKEVTEHGTIQR